FSPGSARHWPPSFLRRTGHYYLLRDNEKSASFVNGCAVKNYPFQYIGSITHWLNGIKPTSQRGVNRVTRSNSSMVVKPFIDLSRPSSNIVRMPCSRASLKNS